MIVTKSFDDSLFKVVLIEPSDIMKGASDFVSRNKSQRIRALDPSTILAGIK